MLQHIVHLNPIKEKNARNTVDLSKHMISKKIKKKNIEQKSLWK